MISLANININWHRNQLHLPISDESTIQILKPNYPPALDPNQLQSILQKDINEIQDKIHSAKKIVLILEDTSRITITANLVEILIEQLHQINGEKTEIDLIIAAGAHFNLSEKELTNKVGNALYTVHTAIDKSELITVGKSKAGIPLIFNKKVVQADLRLSISTVNIHPLAGYSGGGKILLPGVAGLETIFPFHTLPSGTPGIYENELRALINEVTELLPISYSWQLLANTEGKIVNIFGNNLFCAHRQAITYLKKMVTVTKPERPVELLLAGCQPFNLNLLSTFKSLSQLPKLLQPGGRVVLFNEALQGTGDHHWRNKPEVVQMQQRHYQTVFNDYTVGVYSPDSNQADFTYLFPESFRLIMNTPDLIDFINFQKTLHVLVLPYAPITLIK